MRIILILIYCVPTALAWLAPERCVQDSTRYQRSSTTTTVPVSTNITQIANEQLMGLKEKYKDYKLFSLPVGPECVPNKDVDKRGTLYIQEASNCNFHTYNPDLVSTVNCRGVTCSLTEAVATTDSYTANEGYNWGVKVSVKARIGSVFEIGAEASVGGTYSCAFTKAKTITRTVGCSEKGRGTLQLYRVRTDMECDIRKIELKTDSRLDASKTYTTYREYSRVPYPDDETNLYDTFLYPSGDLHPCISKTPLNHLRADMIDPDKFTDNLKVKIQAWDPAFNPNTDVVKTNWPDWIYLFYFKKATTTYKTRKTIIPFTNEEGAAVNTYTCIFTPS